GGQERRALGGGLDGADLVRQEHDRAAGGARADRVRDVGGRADAVGADRHDDDAPGLLRGRHHRRVLDGRHDDRRLAPAAGGAEGRQRVGLGPAARGHELPLARRAARPAPRALDARRRRPGEAVGRRGVAEVFAQAADDQVAHLRQGRGGRRVVEVDAHEVNILHSPMGDLGVYVHFPWCRVRCPYCDFAVAVAPLADIPHDAYADAVLAELERQAPRFAGRVLRSIYFGGGTPSLWRPDAIARTIGAIRGRLGDPGEITVEANPQDCVPATLAALRAARVTPLSIGAQSFGDDHLRFLGPDHSAPAPL